MYEIIEDARAKINLSLDIEGTTEEIRDGKSVFYHRVSMIMHSVSLSDTVKIKTLDSDELLLKLDDNASSDIPGGADNLCIRAARLMQEALQIKTGFEITLKKRIPSAAGLGGGSSDAAAVMRGINRLFDNPLSNEKMRTLSVPLGADIPYCIEGRTFLSEGIGEVLTELLPFPSMPCVLIKPDFPISTKEAYGRYDKLSDIPDAIRHPDTKGLVSYLKEKKYEDFFRETGNVLEDVCRKDHQEIKSIEDDAYNNGALLSMMSGSGPTVFALFSSKENAESFAALYKSREGIENAFFCMT